MSSAEVSSSLPLTPRRERLHAFLDDQCACQQPADDEASDFLSTCEAIVGELVDPLHSALANIDELEDEFAQQQTSREPNEDADWEKVGSCKHPLPPRQLQAEYTWAQSSWGRLCEDDAVFMVPASACCELPHREGRALQQQRLRQHVTCSLLVPPHPPALQFDIGSIDYPWALKLRLAKVWTPTMRDKVSYLIGNALMW